MERHPKLTVLFEKLRGKTFNLDKDQMSIGRKDTNDICLKDSSLSGHHADIFRMEEDGKTYFVLKDNDSTNGTRVNNVPITEQRLKTSDIILFGGVEVLFDSDDADSASSITQTHTIDLTSIDSNVASVPHMVNLSPFAGTEEKKHAMVQKIIIGVVAIVGLALIVVVGFAVVKMFSMGS